MNWTYKLNKSLLKKTKNSSSSFYFITFLSSFSIAISVCTIMLSTFFVKGFQQKVEDKIFNFWANIHIIPFQSTNNYLDQSLNFSTNNLNKLYQNKDISKVSKTVVKGVIFRNKNLFEGMLLKGIDLNELNTDFFNLIQQKSNIKYKDSNEILIYVSNTIAKKLALNIDKLAFLTFVNQQSKIVKCRVVGIYNSGISEFDNQTLFTDYRNVQKLNNWNNDKFSSIELTIKEKSKILEVSKEIYKDFPEIDVKTIFEIYPQMFDWLSLMEQNEKVILYIMLIVSIINIVSTMSIYILERSFLIGILKVLGANNRMLYFMFGVEMLKIVFKGIFFGLTISLIIVILQIKYKFISLNSEIYYVDYAPMKVQFIDIIRLLSYIIITSFLTIFIPLAIINKISPIKVIQYK